MPDVVIPGSAAAILSMLAAGDPEVVKQENFLSWISTLERSGLVQIAGGSTLHGVFAPHHPGGICIELTDKGRRARTGHVYRQRGLACADCLDPSSHAGKATPAMSFPGIIAPMLPGALEPRLFAILERIARNGKHCFWVPGPRRTMDLDLLQDAGFIRTTPRGLGVEATILDRGLQMLRRAT